MIEGIAQGVGNGFRPGSEFFEGRGIAGAKTLGHAIGAHDAPFVVIARETDF